MRFISWWKESLFYKTDGPKIKMSVTDRCSKIKISLSDRCPKIKISQTDRCSEIKIS